jgi:hypothetical protein
VECQLETLKKCLTVAAVRKALQELPRTLDDTYNRILDNIPEEYRKEAICVMRLLAVSFRPLTIEEVAEATAVDVENEEFDTENRLRNPEVILEICSSLVKLASG